MSSATNNFLSLIPAAHRVAVITPFAASVDNESVIPVLQKTRRSSSAGTTESNPDEVPVLSIEKVVLVESPTGDVAVPINTPQFLKLGN